MIGFSTQIQHDDGKQHSRTLRTRDKDHVDVHTERVGGMVSERGCVSVDLQQDGQMGVS